MSKHAAPNDDDTYRVRSLEIWSDPMKRIVDGAPKRIPNIRAKLEQDIDRPAQISIVLGGAGLQFTGTSDDGIHFDLDEGLTGIDEIIRILTEARTRASAEWPNVS